MKKRLLCLALCVIMTALVFTGCANSSDTDKKEKTKTTVSTGNKAMTIVMTGIKNASTTDEAIAKVEKEINMITEADFNMHVILRLYSESEFDAKVEEQIAAIEEQILKAEEEAKAKKEAERAAKEAAKAAAAGKETTAAETTTEETTEEGDETIINAYGIEETLYPKENGTQLDILLIKDFAHFNDYNSKGLFVALDEQLSIGSKILKQYIHPTFLAAAKSNGKTIAIPNNHVIGEYEYLLLDKALVDKYYYDFETVNDIVDIRDFILDVIKYEPDYIPLLGEPEQRVEYFSSKPSLVGSYVPKKSQLGVSAAPKNLLTVAQYLSHFKFISELKAGDHIAYDGYVGDGRKYAAALVKGDYTTPDLYENDYYVSVYKYPTATSENVYCGMYGVTKYAADAARCMDIIKSLTINEELVNLYTYGVEGVHYNVNEVTGVISINNKDYSMNPLYTGNQFLMYQNSDMNELELKLSANKWELAKKQNLDMVYSGYLGYEMKYTEEVKDKEGNVTVNDIKVGAFTIKEIVDEVEKASQGYLEQIANFKPYMNEVVEKKSKRLKYPDGHVETIEEEEIKLVEVTVDDFIADLSKEVAANVYIAAAINAKEATSPTSQYSTWLAAAYPPPAK